MTRVNELSPVERASADLQPTDEKARYQVMDVLRGFALCGILLMNIIVMGGSTVRYFPQLPADMSNPDWVVWFVHDVFFEGTMRGLFTLLFGAGMILITMRGNNGAGTIEAADVYFRRCICLIGLGVLNFAGLLFPGDVLYIYGVSGLFLFVFRKERPRTLLLLAAAIIAMLMMKSGLEKYETAQDVREGRAIAEQVLHGATPTPEQQAVLDDYSAALEQRDPSPQALRTEARERTGGYLDVMRWSIGEWIDYGLAPYTVIIIAESIAFMLMGMALLKTGVLTGQKSLSFYLTMAVVGYAVGLTVNLWESLSLWHDQFSPTLWLPRSTYELGRWGATFGHLGLIISLWKLNALGWPGKMLEAIGKTALTNYLGQSLITAVLFYGFGLWNHLGWAGLWGVVAAIWLFQGVASLIWIRYFRYGPMEWLLRTAAYGRRQPFRRKPGPPAAPVEPTGTA